MRLIAAVLAVAGATLASSAAAQDSVQAGATVFVEPFIIGRVGRSASATNPDGASAGLDSAGNLVTSGQPNQSYSLTVIDSGRRTRAAQPASLGPDGQATIDTPSATGVVVDNP